MKKLWPVLLLIVFSGHVSADTPGITSTITEGCPAGYEQVISLSAPNRSYSNPAAPGFYPRDLCMKGIKDAKISTSCNSPDFYIHGNSSYSHFSTDSAYSLNICITEMETTVRSSCNENETAYLSVSGTHNAHVAWPGHFDNQLCGLPSDEPENVTLEMSLDSGGTVYIDDVNTKGPVRIAEFPYIARENPPYVRGIVSWSMLKAVSSDNKRKLSLKTGAENAQFLVPFTEGDHEDIEERQEPVLDRNFLEMVNPSFGGVIPEDPYVKTILLGEGVNFTSRIQVDPGTYTIQLKKTGENEVSIRQK